MRFPDELVSRYGDLDMSLKGHEILEEICIKSLGSSWWDRDHSRGASHVLDDFQQGRLGRITLENTSRDIRLGWNV